MILQLKTTEKQPKHLQSNSSDGSFTILNSMPEQKG